MCLLFAMQMPTQGAVTNLIAAPQGVLRNFYPLSGYCLDKCEDINIDLFRSKWTPALRGVTTQRGCVLLVVGRWQG
jgi:hypothetical protein